MRLEALLAGGNKPSWFKQPCMVGVDEAGRGPVLGPMVYGVAFCSLDTGKSLGRRSFADSKQLKEDKRDALFRDIDRAEDLGFEFDSISASMISGLMLGREKTSLNKIANDSTYGLIQRLIDEGVNVAEVFVDTVGSATVYQSKLAERFPGITFTVESKADATYPIVSAASIVAKVTRDRQVKEWEFQEKGIAASKELGSGYPGDPATKAWLDRHVDPVFGYPSLVRFSWQTCETLLEAKGIKVAWECQEEADEEGGAGKVQPGQAKLGFGPAAANGANGKGVGPRGADPKKRHAFFRTRSLSVLAKPLLQAPPSSVLGKRSRETSPFGGKENEAEAYDDDDYI